MRKSFENEAKRQQISQQVQENKQSKASMYIPGEKNGKWSDDEHMKYIAYIDFFKEKMRSKQKRRSNEFYKQMSEFIGSRNGLQCRSHHQKLQQKYVYTNKIIAAFKQKFDIERYHQQLNKLKKIKVQKQSNKQILKENNSSLVSVSSKNTKDAQVQTQLQGIGFSILMADQMTVLMYPQIQSLELDSRSFFYPSNLFFQQLNMINFPETFPTKTYF